MGAAEASVAILVAAPVMPPGQLAVPAPVSGASMCFCQATLPVSLSNAYTLFDTPVTTESGRKIATPPTTMPCPSA